MMEDLNIITLFTFARSKMSETPKLLCDSWQYAAELILEKTEHGEDVLILSGKMQHANVRNANGRVYPKKFLEREVAKLQPIIKARKLFGELDHPDTATVSYDRASHMIVEADFKKGSDEVHGKYRILRDHPKGQIVKAILKEGGSISTSSRAIGSSSRGDINGESADVIGDDLKLITWDLVADNSTPGCDNWKPINESVIHQLLETGRKSGVKSKDFQRQLMEAVETILYKK